jgi:FdhD protein
MKPDDAVLVPGGARRLPVQGVRGGRLFAGEDWVAEEVPVAIECNGIVHAVMLATPLDLADFALGFALSEGLVAQASELYGVEAVESDRGITLQLDIASAAFARVKQRRRAMAGPTGCGLCGVESLRETDRALPQLEGGPTLARAAVARAMSELSSMQSLRHATGAVHAAAWCSAEGAMRLLREDVGRHNALDKLVGAMTREAVEAGSGFIVVTSRASLEMVQKTARAGVTMMAAVSAPTTLAVATAQRCGLTLAGFVRDDDLVVYSHPRRVNLDASA